MSKSNPTNFKARAAILALSVAVTSIMQVSGGSNPAAAATNATSDADSTSDVAFLTPEEYGALYEKKFGKSAPASIIAPDIESIAATETPSASKDRVESAQVALDPPGGSDARWDLILYSYWDKRKTYMPLRLGNSDLGYNHYAKSHNLYTFAQYKALASEKPVKDIGAHQEYYIALATKLSNAEVKETVVIIGQAASRTDDGRYATTDGGNVGIITSYCKGKTLCPDWINNLK